MKSFNLIAIVFLTTTAAVWDWRERRIPNWLCLAGLFLGFLLNDWLFAAQGLALALAIHLPLFALRATGGGDVKLMAALGALMGASGWLRLFIVSAVLGGLVAITLVLFRGQARDTASRLAFVLSSLGRAEAPYKSRPELDVTTGMGRTLPRGVIVAMAIPIWIALNARFNARW